jgi:NAD-specific glutamate dehydrogenase
MSKVGGIRMNGDYELLEEAIELLNSHTVMVGSIILAERLDRFNQVVPARYLNKEERESLTKAMELLLEMRNNERKREQDEHAIAFAKEYKEEE